jgi:hypothetical protein
MLLFAPIKSQLLFVVEMTLGKYSMLAQNLYLQVTQLGVKPMQLF